MAHDALGAHARDELGISDITAARPLQAAGASALSFAAGASLPLAVVALVPPASLAIAVAVAALIALACLGGLAERRPIVPDDFDRLCPEVAAMAATLRELDQGAGGRVVCRAPRPPVPTRVQAPAPTQPLIQLVTSD